MYAEGALAQYLRESFGQKKNLTEYFSGKTRSYYIQTRHNDLFSHYNLLLGKLEEKLARKARVNAERVYRIVLMPPGHPVILLNLINSIWLPYR